MVLEVVCCAVRAKAISAWPSCAAARAKSRSAGASFDGSPLVGPGPCELAEAVFSSTRPTTSASRTVVRFIRRLIGPPLEAEADQQRLCPQGREQKAYLKRSQTSDHRLQT